MNEELIQVLATATQVACAAITATGQAALQASLDQARDTPLEFGWERRAAAHAEFFTTLADAAGDVAREDAELDARFGGIGLADAGQHGEGGNRPKNKTLHDLSLSPALIVGAVVFTFATGVQGSQAP